MKNGVDLFETKRRFRRMSQIQWATTGLTLLAVITLVLGTPVVVRYNGVSLNLVVGTIFGVAALVYTYIRFDLRVAALCDAVSQLSLFIIVGGFASYLAAYLGRWSSFWDDHLLAFDHALGFDWLSYLAFMSDHAFLASVLNAAYLSILWQAAALVIALVVLADAARLQTFTLAFQISALVCVVGSALLPALGAYPHLQIESHLDHPGIPLATMNAHVETMMQLRGAFPSLTTATIEGIVTFPSLHMALAVLFIWGFWRVPGLRWVALGLNALMILATPLSGGHYVTDLIAGAAVAIFALTLASLARRQVDRALAGPQTTSPDLLPTPHF